MTEDLVIIGSGPAGYTTAIYAGRSAGVPTQISVYSGCYLAYCASSCTAFYWCLNSKYVVLQHLLALCLSQQNHQESLLQKALNAHE